MPIVILGQIRPMTYTTEISIATISLDNPVNNVMLGF